MSASRWLWLVVVALGLVVVQLTIANELSIDGVHPELLWVLPVAAGLAAGAMAGMAAGFVGGVVADLFLPSPFGLSAFVGVLIGYAHGPPRRGGRRRPARLGAGGSPLRSARRVRLRRRPVLYAACGAVLGHRTYLVRRRSSSSPSSTPRPARCSCAR